MSSYTTIISPSTRGSRQKGCKLSALEGNRGDHRRSRWGGRSRTHDPLPPSHGNNINTQDPGPAPVLVCISTGGDPQGYKY